MVDGYIAGAKVLIDDRIAYAKTAGLSARVGATYRMPSAPWRKVYHTMEAPEDDPGTVPDEGWELDQIIGYVIRHRTPPHLWALPLHDVVLQTVPLTKSAYALRHDDPAGVNETNHAHAVQTEVIGYARDGLDDPGLCDWLGERVLGPVLDAGVPVTPFVVAPSTGADGYGLDGKVRMSWTQWANFGGQCGHANVPGQQHWDPGVADYLRIARAANNREDTLKLDAEDQRWLTELVRGEVARAAQYIAGGRNNAVYDPSKVAWMADAATLPQLKMMLDRFDPPTLAAAVAAELGGGVDATVVEAAVRRVFADAADAG